METKQTKSEATGTNLKPGTTETYLGPEPNGKTLGAGAIETDLWKLKLKTKTGKGNSSPIWLETKTTDSNSFAEFKGMN